MWPLHRSYFECSFKHSIKSTIMKKLFVLMLFLAGSYVTFAQSDKTEKSGKKATPAKIQTQYSCPMHPEVTSNKPGKCTKCDRDLTLSKKEQMKKEVMKTYTCPMHSEVSSEKPGTCPTCSQKLVERKPSSSKKNKS